MKTFCSLLVVVSALFLSSSTSKAQFDENSMLLGPHIGLAAYESAPVFGANFETAVNKPGQLGPGILGVSGRIDYFSYDYFTDWSYTWINVAAYCNYHFKVGETGEFDPFVGLGIGYQNVSVDYNGVGEDLYSESWGSGIFFAGNAGARYFLSKALALRALVGFGVSFLVVGVDFAI